MKRNSSRIIIFISLMLMSLLSACGSSSEKTQSLSSIQKNTSANLTLYIHGFDMDGYEKSGVYGEEIHDESLKKLEELSAYQSTDNTTKTLILKATSYYGDTAPLYYSEQDLQDINAITQEWEGGIPRYALIVAKHAKHLMQQYNTDKINIISGSMGSLVTRWMIEKDVEKLASNHQISKWYSLEGVISGNYAAGKKDVIDHFYGDLDSIDITHMSPTWIAENLHSPAREAASPYYKHILLGQEASTDDDLGGGALTNFLMINGQFSANDGTQRVEDSHFRTITEAASYNNMPPTFTLFHKNHLNLKEHEGAWASVLTFLNAKKRIKITLVDAQVDNLHETIRWYNRRAEVIFGSQVYSPQTELIWGTTAAISERVRDGATLPVHIYREDGEKKTLNQVVFDQFVPEAETELRLNLIAEEIDYGPKYGVYEIRAHHYALIDDTTITLPLENGTYHFDSHDWSFNVNVEVTDYSD